VKRLLSILGAAMLLCVLPANAATKDAEGDNPGVPGARTLTPEEEAARANVTEDPSPIFPAPAQMPQYWITIDLRPTPFSFNPDFIATEMPTPIIPKGWGVKIIVPDPPDPDSGCNTAQNKKSGDLCKKQKQKLASCEVNIVFNDDGTPSRTLICQCYTPGATPEVAGTVLDTTEYRIAD
jgi:hypothetical protein